MAMHDFLLIKNHNSINTIIDNYFSANNTNIYNKVKIHDDIILYIMDTLRFIKYKWVLGEMK